MHPTNKNSRYEIAERLYYSGTKRLVLYTYKGHGKRLVIKIIRFFKMSATIFQTFRSGYFKFYLMSKEDRPFLIHNHLHSCFIGIVLLMSYSAESVTDFV